MSLLYQNPYVIQQHYRVIRIHGLQNSGTNLITKYLKLHFNIYIDESGWKHQLLSPLYCNKYPSFIDNRVLKIFVIKDPYFWLQSMFKSPYEVMSIQRPLTINDYILRPVKLIAERGGMIYRNPIYYWRLWYERNISLMNSFNTPMIMIKYEDILTNPIQVITELKQYLIPKIDHINIIEEPAKSHGYSRNRQQALSYYNNLNNKTKDMNPLSIQLIKYEL